MKKRQKWIVFAVAAMMLLGNIAMAFGQGLVFTDIEKHWAREYIEDIYQRKITSGYTDATYRPDNSISGIEIVTMLARLLQYDPKTENYTAKFKAQLEANGIPDWAEEYIAFMLNEGIVKEDELDLFMTNGNINNLKRYEMVIFMGRVLVEYGGEEISTVYSLPYQDQMFIPQDAKGYVDLMLRTELLNPASNEGRFLPLNNITRGETAKLIAMAAKLLDEYDAELRKQKEEEQEVEEPEQEIEDVEDEVILEEDEIIVVKGVFSKLEEGGNRTILTMTDDKNKLQIYDVKSTVKVVIDDKSARLSDLRAGQHIEVKLVNDKVEEIKGNSNQEVFKGYYVRFMPGNNDVLTLKDETGANKVFVVPKGVKVTLNGKETPITNFVAGDVVRLFNKQDVMVEIQGKSKTEFIEGVITDKGTLNNQYIEVTTKAGEVLSFPMETTTTYRRDNRTSNFTSLKVSDEVKLELEYDKVKNLIATVIRSKTEGYIRNIAIGKDGIVLAIEKSGGTIEEFQIGQYTTIKMGDESAEVYDLRLNYFVEVSIESNEVVLVYTSRKIETERLMGVVTYVNTSNNLIEIEYVEDGRLTSRTVNTKSSTVYLGFSTASIRGVKVGDEVLLTGQTTKGIFMVDRVLLIESK